MQALILAGGLGTRLRPLVNDRPKSMAAISNKPFLEYQIELLKRSHIVNVILCTGYRHEQIQAHFQTGEAWGINIKYSVEEHRLGTAGALKNAEKYVTETFLALNGDSYADLNLEHLIQFHRTQQRGKRRALGTIALTEASDTQAYGCIQIDLENTVSSFTEKSGQSNSHLINAGIYVLEPEILTHVPPARKVSLEKETFPTVIKDGHTLFGYLTAGFFVDIGTPEGYSRFQRYITGAEHDHP